jgi:hypothetical protein
MDNLTEEFLPSEPSTNRVFYKNNLTNFYFPPTVKLSFLPSLKSTSAFITTSIKMPHWCCWSFWQSYSDKRVRLQSPMDTFYSALDYCRLALRAGEESWELIHLWDGSTKLCAAMKLRRPLLRSLDSSEPSNSATLCWTTRSRRD